MWEAQALLEQHPSREMTRCRRLHRHHRRYSVLRPLHRVATRVRSEGSRPGSSQSACRKCRACKAPQAGVRLALRRRVACAAAAAAACEGYPELQTPSTLDALDALVEHEVIARMQADTLREPHGCLSNRLRNAALAVTGAHHRHTAADNPGAARVCRAHSRVPGWTAQRRLKRITCTPRGGRRRIFEQLFFEE